MVLNEYKLTVAFQSDLGCIQNLPKLTPTINNRKPLRSEGFPPPPPPLFFNGNFLSLWNAIQIRISEYFFIVQIIRSCYS